MRSSGRPGRGSASAWMLLAASFPGAAAAAEPPARPVHTFSIVARDPATGRLGAAVQSHWFSVGSIVIWAEAGVGAVATQSFVEPSYGPRGLALMKEGRSAPEALGDLLARDPHPEVRQIAMVDAAGRVGAHTGARCIAAAGHVSGEGWSAQANLMTDASVWPAMAKAWEAGGTDFPERLLAALEAAQSRGGDIRGRQSAAIVIVEAKPTGRIEKDRLMDLRVEDHPDPIGELRRLVGVWRAYERMNAGDEAVTAGRIEEALGHYAAAEAMQPGNAEFVFWHAATLASLGRAADSLPIFERAFRLDPAWLLLVDRLPAAGLLPDDPSLLGKIRAAAPRAR